MSGYSRSTSAAVAGSNSPRRSGTLSRSRSSDIRNKSLDEGSALSDLHRKADKELEDERRREAEAMKYWDEMKKEEQQKFSDEDSDSGVSSNATKTKHNFHAWDDSDYSQGHNLHKSTTSRLSAKSSDRPSSALGSGDYREKRDYSDGKGLSNGLEAVKVWQEKYSDIEGKFKESMVSNAQLYNEKTVLVYQVEALKDRLEDNEQELVEVKANLQREHSQCLHLKHQEETTSSELDSLRKQIQFRDDFIERCGLQLPTGEEEEEPQFVLKGKGMSEEEREDLLKQIESLKEEIASMRSGSLLGDQQPRDIVQVSTRMVSEYKTKLQIAEAENTRLEGTVNRLKGQVTRYKNQVKELEEREDELMKNKRQQGKEIRSLQSESEDFKTEIDLLKRRIEQLKKRKDYGDS